MFYPLAFSPDGNVLSGRDNSRRLHLWAAPSCLVRTERAARGFELHPESGAVFEAYRTAMRAGLAALEGRIPEATRGYLEATSELRRVGLLWELARTQLDFVIAVGPGVREARDAAEEARATFERLGARPYLERLEAAVGPGDSERRPAASPSGRSDPVTA